MVADTAAAHARAVAAARADTAVARAFAPDGGTSGRSTVYGRAVVACSNAAGYAAAYAYASGYADPYNCTSVSAVTAAASFAAAAAVAQRYAARAVAAARFVTAVA